MPPDTVTTAGVESDDRDIGGLWLRTGTLPSVTRAVDTVVVGDSGDAHVVAVLARIPRAMPLIVDAEVLSHRGFQLHQGVFKVFGDPPHGESLVLDSDSPVRGWIRRLAPSNWQRGMVVDSHDATVKTAWLALLVAMIRTCNIEWLTPLDQLITAENKLVQEAAARRLGLPVPETIVCSDAALAREVLGKECVLKPLGPGHFYEDDQAFVVYTTAVDPEGDELGSLASVPFIAQRRLKARQHLRVVTVGERVWGGCLDGADLPVDWRKVPIAHRSFAARELPAEATDGARRLAGELHLGYSSQDWIVCEDACYVVDVNPGGQWLFLPDAVSEPVAGAIADWLRGCETGFGR